VCQLLAVANPNDVAAENARLAVVGPASSGVVVEAFVHVGLSVKIPLSDTGVEIGLYGP